MEADPQDRVRRRAGSACAVLLLTVLCCDMLQAQSQSISYYQPEVAPPAASPQADDSVEQAEPLSPLAELEQLLQSEVEVPAFDQEVTTVSGTESTVGRSPAAVFVITQEMIRRSGATSIPEVLRMAPGLQVARMNSNQWAITSRGFNSNILGLFATNNKLLVLIDGRTVYTPFAASVYWDVQDVLLEDIERIEVIRGPGATIWGANAVNGVINIITKNSADTTGGIVKARGGTEERAFTGGRVGGRISENATYRVYGKWFERDSSFNPILPPTDDWRQGRGGFRMDWNPNCGDTVTLQGDYYEGQSGFFNLLTAGGADETVRGGNILTRWTRTYSDDNDVSLQCYYDRADRNNHLGFIDQQYDTYDIDFRHHRPVGSYHDVVWGLGYRSVHDKLTRTTNSIIFFDPSQRTYDTFSAFLQDEVTVLEDMLFVTLGAKLQHNDFTDWEIQPTARVLYSADPTRAAWAAVSRAVRTPSRLEHDMRLPALLVDMSNTFQSEELIAYELGYREQPAEWFSWDLALFYNQYENLQSFQQTGLVVFNNNVNRGEGYGVELAAQVDMTPTWKLSGNYSFLRLHIQPGTPVLPNEVGRGEDVEGSSPHNQMYLMSSHQLTESTELDLIGRYVDNVPFQNVPSYVELDVRLAWHPVFGWEFAVVGQNLLDSHHPETQGGLTSWVGLPKDEIQRGVYGAVTHVW